MRSPAAVLPAPLPSLRRAVRPLGVSLCQIRGRLAAALSSSSQIPFSAQPRGRLVPALFGDPRAEPVALQRAGSCPAAAPIFIKSAIFSVQIFGFVHFHPTCAVATNIFLSQKYSRAKMQFQHLKSA